ncbi:MAG: ABC transporter permease [Chloroflexota bacterium]|nr:ABC transporter permease [Chloroflexota bacterium]
MENLFGVPMQSIMIVLLVMLGICLLSIAFIAWRRPVIFKMGLRNIPRRKPQTVLIIVGLMLATLIISAALGTGDTLNHSVRSQAIDTLGPVDEFVVFDDNPDQDPNIAMAFVRPIPEDTVQTIREMVADNDDVDGVAGVLLSRAPFINVGENDATGATTQEQLSQIAVASEPVVNIAGINQESIAQIGGAQTTDGKDVNVDNLGRNGIYINEESADKLNAQAGHDLVFFVNNERYVVTVEGILPDSLISGSLPDFFSGSAPLPGMLMSLDRLQEISGQQGLVSGVAISNTGGTEAGLARSDSVVQALESDLDGRNLGTVPIKQDIVETAELIGSLFVTFFIVFGLFSIGVGILLIVLIFTMLAAERRSEMGMTRAVGAQRRQLIQQFLSEGAGYTLISGFVGTALGVAAAFLIAKGFQSAFGDAFNISPYISLRSMVIAYCLGVVITFLAVAISSWRVSRLNVVAAVRDITDAYLTHKNSRQLVWSILMIAGGAGLILLGRSSELLAPFSIGMTLIPFGIAGILTYFGAKPRLVLTSAGLLTLVFWLLPDNLFRDIFGDYSGDIDMFFVSGICIVAASTLVIVQNLDTILAVVERLGGRVRGMLAPTRLAVSYPGANKGRTGMTIAMFSLIVFSLVMIAAINANFAAAFLNDKAFAGWDVSVDASKENPIDDLNQVMTDTGVDTARIADVGRVDLPGEGSLSFQNRDGEWLQSDFAIGDRPFYEGGQLTFQARANGYNSDEAIIDALLNEPGVVVVPSTLAENAPADFEASRGVTGVPEEGSFTAPTIDLRTGDSQTHQARVIGVLDNDYSYFFGIYSGQPTMDSLFPDLGEHAVQYYMHVAEGAAPEDVANDIEVNLLPYGVVGTDLAQQLEDEQSTQQSFMYVLQGFMGLGLIVGIAAVGVIAFRAVVERRQQIGMIRALGFQRGMVQSVFVIESGIVVILGVLAGTVFGLMLSYLLMTSDDFTEGAPDAGAFIIPWLTIIATLSASIVAALLMAWLPARQASRVLPAEALRYE